MTSLLKTSRLNNYYESSDNQESTLSQLTNEKIVPYKKFSQSSKLENFSGFNLGDLKEPILEKEKDKNQIDTNQVIKKSEQSFLNLTSNKVVNLNSLDRFNNYQYNIKDYYSLEDENEIVKYLSNKQKLIAMLVEAYQHIRKIYTDDKLILAIIDDPEIIDWKQLVIIIKTKLNADEAFDKLKLLDNQWWLEASHNFDNNLDIHIDFDEI